MWAAGQRRRTWHVVQYTFTEGNTRGVPRRDVVVRTVKAKRTNRKKAAAVKKSGAGRKTARRASPAAAKYEQPGAPWWKRVPAPPQKSI
jgi:hypothetical protein